MGTYCIAQEPVPSICENLNEKEILKRRGWVYVYIELIHFAVQQKLTTL